MRSFFSLLFLFFELLEFARDDKETGDLIKLTTFQEEASSNIGDQHQQSSMADGDDRRSTRQRGKPVRFTFSSAREQQAFNAVACHRV